MANVLSESKQQQVVALGRLGWTLRRIEAETAVRRETASAYLKAAGVVVGGKGRRPREWPRPKPAISAEVATDSGQAKPATTVEVATDLGRPKPAISVEVATDPGRAKPATTVEVATDSAAGFGPPQRGRAPTASACEPYRELIVEALAKGRNATAIWQDLVDEHGFRAAYGSVKRFARKLRGSTATEARVIITTAPGEEAQVDYGDGPMVLNRETGKYRRTRLFVLTLGYSRKSVRLLTWKSSTQVWAELHERAFRRLGGAPKIVVLDNLREGVIEADHYDPELNPLYRDVLKHYGVVALPCRVRDPDRKGKVEAGVGHAQRTPLKGMRFESLDEAQQYLDRWEAHWADTRIHGTTKRQVSTMFAEEKPALRDLPVEPFRYYQFGERTVHLDGCVEVEAAYYGAPPGHIGEKLRVQWDGTHVRLIDAKTGQLLREHLRQRRGHHRIHDDDRPSRTPQTTEALLSRTRAAGSHIGALCTEIHHNDGEPGVRRILGVLSLARKYGAAVVDDAAKAALELGVPSYRFLRRYIERRLPVPLTLRQVDPLIRQLSAYRDLIDHRTGEPI
jgi:transposase